LPSALAPHCAVALPLPPAFPTRRSSDLGRGCKGLITGDGVRDAVVMGDGVIDGRGGEAILGQNVSWWNLADRARHGGSQNVPRLDRKSTRLNSSHEWISYAVFCLKKTRN